MCKSKRDCPRNWAYQTTSDARVSCVGGVTWLFLTERMFRRCCGDNKHIRECYETSQNRCWFNLTWLTEYTCFNMFDIVWMLLEIKILDLQTFCIFLKRPIQAPQASRLLLEHYVILYFQSSEKMFEWIWTFQNTKHIQCVASYRE